MTPAKLTYDSLLYLAAPFGAAWLATQARYRPMLGRFRPAAGGGLPERPLWIQACSVGELGVARTLANQLASEAFPPPVLLTSSTVQGWNLARTTQLVAGVSWFPFDLRPAVAGFFRRVRPRALVLIETELWPNVLAEAQRRGVPVLLVNGRLSDRHFARYRRVGGWFRELVGSIAAAGMQDNEHVRRIVELGVRPDRAHVTGNMKFDGVSSGPDPDVVRALAEGCSISAGVPVVVFGSTRPGDEALALRCLRELRTDFPGLRLILVPRHLERVHEVVQVLGSEPFVRRSELARSPRNHDSSSAPVILVDTMGELTAFYGLATVAVVGGSFYAGVEGHNPLEPAALGVPTVFGPHMRNFAEARRVLVERGGAVEVPSADGLAAELRALLADPDARAGIAGRGQAAVLENRGATARTITMLRPFLGLEPEGRRRATEMPR